MFKMTKEAFDASVVYEIVEKTEDLLSKQRKRLLRNEKVVIN
jgi:hypothetical protein